MANDLLGAATLLAPCVLCLWAAIACRRAHADGLPGSDAMVWAALSMVFLFLLLVKIPRSRSLLRSISDFLRNAFRSMGWYEDRRVFQIAASVMVAVVVTALTIWGLVWIRDYFKRYRLAIGLAGLTVGFGVIRFISLHEVDAWNADATWARTVVDVLAAVGVSAVVIARLRQLATDTHRAAVARSDCAPRIRL